MRWEKPSLAPMVVMTSRSGSRSTPNRRMVEVGERLAQLGDAPAGRVAVVAGVVGRLAAASRPPAPGDGMSGLPKPRSITSMPARRASIFSPSMIVKTYGGRPGDAAELHAPNGTPAALRQGRPTRAGAGAADVTDATPPRLAATWHVGDHRRVTTEIDVVIEIPRGSRNKYEYDHEAHVFRLDRRLFTATDYPADYGFIPDTLSEDGDPLDALVLLEDPTFPGCWITARPVGVFWMEDDTGPDAKILCVPAGDPRWEQVEDIADLPDPPGRRDRALLRGLQGARARQALERPRLGGRRAPPSPRSRRAASGTPTRRTDAGTDARRCRPRGAHRPPRPRPDRLGLRRRYGSPPPRAASRPPAARRRRRRPARPARRPRSARRCARRGP